jgi:hypothetical protein
MQMSNRGTALVASADAQFTNALSTMVSASGFRAESPREREAPWITVTRTQPTIVICDCAHPVARLERLLLETSARRVPLLLSRAAEQCLAPKLPEHQRVEVFTFPVSRADLDALLDALVPPPVRRVRGTKARLAAPLYDARQPSHIHPARQTIANRPRVGERSGTGG